DLRSPLTAITAAGDVLAEAAGVSPAERAELVSSIRFQAARLDRLVANLLDLSRLEAGAARPKPEPWTVDGLLAQALAALGDAAERVVLRLPGAAPAVRVDPGQLERVLVNLLENALRASSEPVEVLVE